MAGHNRDQKLERFGRRAERWPARGRVQPTKFAIFFIKQPQNNRIIKMAGKGKGAELIEREIVLSRKRMGRTAYKDDPPLAKRFNDDAFGGFRNEIGHCYADIDLITNQAGIELQNVIIDR